MAVVNGEQRSISEEHQEQKSALIQHQNEESEVRWMKHKKVLFLEKRKEDPIEVSLANR